MNKVLIHNDADGDVVLVSALAIENLNNYPAKHGVSESMIIDRSELPSDYTYSYAWSWAGTGYPVVEDIEKLRSHALAMLKTIAGTAALASQKLEAIFESPAHSTDDIREAYLSCKEELTSASTNAEIKHCLNTFKSQYEVIN